MRVDMLAALEMSINVSDQTKYHIIGLAQKKGKHTRSFIRKKPSPRNCFRKIIVQQKILDLTRCIYMLCFEGLHPKLVYERKHLA